MRAAVVTDLNGPDGVVTREVEIRSPNRAKSFRRGIRGNQLSRRPPDPRPLPSASRLAVHHPAGRYPVSSEDSGSFRAGERVAAMPFTGGVAESAVVDPNYVFPVAGFRLLRDRCRTTSELSHRTSH